MIATTVFDVINTPTLICKGGSPTDVKTVMIRAASATCYVGGADVSVAESFAINANEIFSLELTSGDDLYIITATTATVRVLVTRSNSF